MRMYRVTLIGGLFLAIVLCAGVADAALITDTFIPRPADLRDLDHHRYYTWGINADFSGEIVGVTLTFQNLYDWTVEENDHLFVHLLDTVSPGYHSYRDPVDPGVDDFFAGQGILVLDWTDDDENTPVDLEVNLDAAALAAYSEDGNFGFGFDPDCHYFNDGVELRVVTEVVPEPSTLALLGCGIAGLGVAQYRHRKRRLL